MFDKRKRLYAAIRGNPVFMYINEENNQVVYIYIYVFYMYIDIEDIYLSCKVYRLLTTAPARANEQSRCLQRQSHALQLSIEALVLLRGGEEEPPELRPSDTYTLDGFASLLRDVGPAFDHIRRALESVVGGCWLERPTHSSLRYMHRPPSYYGMVMVSTSATPTPAATVQVTTFVLPSPKPQAPSPTLRVPVRK